MNRKPATVEPTVRPPDSADDFARRLDKLEASLATLQAAHTSHAGHLRHIDRARDSIEAHAAAAVQAAREHAAAERAAREGARVRVRAVRDVDIRAEGLRLSPGNTRADVARVMPRAAWEAMVERSAEIRAALDAGAIVVEALGPEAA